MARQSAQVQTHNLTPSTNLRGASSLRPNTRPASAEQAGKEARSLAQSRSRSLRNKKAANDQEFEQNRPRRSPRQYRQSNPNSKHQAKIDQLKNTTYWPLYTLIILHLFLIPIGFIEIIPVVGWAFIFIITVCATIVGIVLLLFQKMEQPYVKTSIHFFRTIIVVVTGFITGIMPIVDTLIPINFFLAVGLLVQARSATANELAKMTKKRSARSRLLSLRSAWRGRAS